MMLKVTAAEGTTVLVSPGAAIVATPGVIVPATPGEVVSGAAGIPAFASFARGGAVNITCARLRRLRLGDVSCCEISCCCCNPVSSLRAPGAGVRIGATGRPGAAVIPGAAVAGLAGAAVIPGVAVAVFPGAAISPGAAVAANPGVAVDVFPGAAVKTVGLAIEDCRAILNAEWIVSRLLEVSVGR